MYPVSHPIEPRGFSEKKLRVAHSKTSPSQARGQLQVIKENMTKPLGSMGWDGHGVHMISAQGGGYPKSKCSKEALYGKVA